MSVSTLAQIKKKVRRLTASPTTNQLSEADLEDYINTFFEQDFPSHLKPWNLYDTMEFYTVPYEDQYIFDTDLYHALNQPVYIDGYNAYYSQDRTEFFNVYPKISTEQTGSVGDGSAGPYTFTLSGTPVLKRAVTLSVLDSTGVYQSCHDVPDTPASNTGTLIDNVSPFSNIGTIDYVTGVTTVTWSNTVDASQSIKANVSQYTASRPNGMLFFNNKMILRPIPDKVYRVTVNVYKKPTTLLGADGLPDNDLNPDVKQWWQYIAFGSAIKVLQDRQDMESIQNLMAFFKEQEALILYRTATQMSGERSATIYSQNNGVVNGFGGGINGF